MLRLRHSANKADAAGDRICPVCKSAITITDGLMRIGDSNEIAHIPCALNRRIAARPRTGEKLMAPLLCTCDHSRDLHRYERHGGGGWTVCQACRCVRFTDQGATAAPGESGPSRRAAMKRPGLALLFVVLTAGAAIAAPIDAGHVLITPLGDVRDPTLIKDYVITMTALSIRSVAKSIGTARARR